MIMTTANWIRLGLLMSALSTALVTATVSAITIPNQPLGVRINATPMVMIAASRDHRLFYEAYNDASDIDGDGLLDIRFKPALTYYGLFDSSLCYRYASNVTPARFIPAGTADSQGRCLTNEAPWSGNWLNYVTTSRIDALRKVLYGGRRVVDTPELTVLERAYIPQDAHSWAKEYTSPACDGYDISEYTDVGLPSKLATATECSTTGSGGPRRHFFGNLTRNANVACTTLSDCSGLPPLLSIVTNSNKRVWEWASTERPVLRTNTHGGTGPTDLVVRVEVCTSNYNAGCSRYTSASGAVSFKPTGLLHRFGGDGSMLFGLITGSYDQNTNGGVLRRQVASFATEFDPETGVFKVNKPGGTVANSPIVSTFDNLRIRDFNNTRTDNAYRRGWVTTRAMNVGEFVDWGNPIGEIMFEAVRYLAGAGSPTPSFQSSATVDKQLNLPTGVSWDDPYKPSDPTEARERMCARPNLLVVSDVSPSFDSDSLPGVFSGFGAGLSASLAGRLPGDTSNRNFSTMTELGWITDKEPTIKGRRFFIGQSGTDADSTPRPRVVNHLGEVRGLAPDDPTRQGSYSAAAVASFARRHDIRPTLEIATPSGNFNDGGFRQTVDTYAVALSSPLPRISVPVGDRRITLVPFAKSVSGSGIDGAKTSFQPTNQIVDFYVEEFREEPGNYKAVFRINFEDVEQGADHDMDVIARYEITANNTSMTVKVRTEYEAGSIGHSIGYVISGTGSVTLDNGTTTAVNSTPAQPTDGIYLVVRDASGTPGYYMNTPPGFLPGACDVATPPTQCGTMPYVGSGESTRVFTPAASGTATGLLPDPLWLAAKWGGFVDENGNNEPDLRTEWDKNNDGVPDTYFLVQNPLNLETQLARALSTIAERTASSGNVAVTSTAGGSETLVFQAEFNPKFWTGDIEATPIANSTRTGWRASAQLPAPSARRIITFSDGQFREFTTTGLTAAQLATLGSTPTARQQVIAWLRGDRTVEQINGGSLRTRSNLADREKRVLGDIVHSSPFYIKQNPAAAYGTVYVNSNAGMLHAFDEETGRELFAYIPANLIADLHEQTSPTYNHRYFLDGEIVVSDRNRTPGKNILVAAYGRGGKGLFALDVTDPNNFGNQASHFLWSYTDTSDADLGLITGRVVLGTLQDGTQVVVAGNGYNSSSGSAVLYVFNLKTGALIRKIDTGVASDNGLASPALALDASGRIETVYAGDLKGNLWAFDLSLRESRTPSQWDVAYKQGSTPAPFFTAINASGQRQPITAQPLIVRNDVAGSPHRGKRFLFIGTGSYLSAADSTNTQVQSLYGLIIDDSTGNPANQAIAISATTRSTVLRQRSIAEVATLAGRTVRTFSSLGNDSMDGVRGWYLDWVNPGTGPESGPQGERVITMAKFERTPIKTSLIVSSQIPSNLVCEPGGTGFVNGLDPFSGAALDVPIFDVNASGVFTDDVINNRYIGSFNLNLGLPSEHVLVGDVLAVGGSQANLGVVRVNVRKLRGRISWREVIR